MEFVLYTQQFFGIEALQPHIIFGADITILGERRKHEGAQVLAFGAVPGGAFHFRIDAGMAAGRCIEAAYEG